MADLLQAQAQARAPESSSLSHRADPKRGRRGSVLSGVISSLLVVAGLSGWALNRFVIDHVEISDAAAYEARHSGSAVERTPGSPDVSSSGKVSGSTYTGDNATVRIKRRVTGNGPDTVTAYIADVELTAATGLRSAFAQNKYGENIIEKPSSIAEGVGAVFAVNGDYYGFRDSGIVIRNGVVYRDKGSRQGLAVYRDGHMEFYDETATDAEDLVADGVWNTLSFGPGLVSDGRVIDGIENVEIDTNFGNHSIQGYQPRTGIGIVDDNHFVIIVVDGRSTGYSRGVTMTEFAQLFVDAGATLAYNLDGGGSSTMYFNGSLVNNPLGRGRERGTSDILYIAD